MSTINHDLPIFKNNIQQQIGDSSNYDYENKRPKQKIPLSRIDVKTSKSFYFLIYIFFKKFAKAHQKLIYLQNQ